MSTMKRGIYVNKMRKTERGHKGIYMRISAGPQRGQYVHRLIVEAKIGRPLTKDETVDHIDGNTLNNHPDNLSEPISYEEHGRRTAARLRREKQKKKLELSQRRQKYAERELKRNQRTIEQERLKRQRALAREKRLQERVSFP